MNSYEWAYELAKMLEQKFSFDGGAGNIGLQAAALLKKQADELRYADEMFEKAMIFIEKLRKEKDGHYG